MKKISFRLYIKYTCQNLKYDYKKNIFNNCKPVECKEFG